MDRRFIGRAIFLRHGQSDYTEIFPDLTDEGKQTIVSSANKMKYAVKAHRDVMIISSPKSRALGSSFIIAEVLGYKGGIKKEPNISSFAIRDKERAKTILYDPLDTGRTLQDEFESRGGIVAVDLAYTHDPRYEDGKILEPRSEVRKRFYKYLAGLVRQLIACPLIPCIIHVSHYEVLYHFVESLFKLDYTRDQTLAHGEIIEVSFYDIGNNDIVEMDVKFRGKILTGVVFNHREEAIQQ